MVPELIEPATRKKILFANTLVDEVREGLKETTNQAKTNALINGIAGKMVKKYRMLGTLSKELGVNRRRLRKASTKSVKIVKRVGLGERQRLIKEKVEIFLQREDNSRMMPGKTMPKSVGKRRSRKGFFLITSAIYTKSSLQRIQT